MEQIDRTKYPRMAWHDVHTMVEGPIVSDITRHFVERWNDARFNKRDNGLINYDSLKTINDKKNKKRVKFELKDEKQNLYNKNKSKVNIGLFKESSKTLKDLKIDLIKEEDSNDGEEGNNNKNNNNKIINTNDEEPKEEEIIIAASEQKGKKLNLLEDYLFDEKNLNDLDLNAEDNKGRLTIIDSIKNKVKHKYEDYKTKHSRKNKKMKIKQKAFLSNDNEQMKDESIEMNFTIQALRSVCSWSIGKKDECSILAGYYNLIDNAKHYIYIENQFFVTKSYSDNESNTGKNYNTLVQNEIGLHIRTRIERAWEKKANFKVFIFIPLLPGFSGTPGESSTINCILKHTYQSIARNNGMSLLEKLKEKMGDEVYNYIYFFSLRNHGIIGNLPVTELIYIHSKLLIVDDEKVLIGSANINDRSMLGERDSEFAVIIEEDKKYNSMMNGEEFMASKYAITLRKQLMAEHLGLKVDDKILNDPLGELLWIKIRSQAKVNSEIYNDIFDCFPDNKFNNFAKLKERKIIKTEEDKKQLKENYDKKYFGIIGHIVEYPIEFLKDEELDIDFFSKEILLPERNFV